MNDPENMQLGLFAQAEPEESAVLTQPLVTTGLLDGLNDRQCEAVSAPADAPLRVLAGAGTGKTELISRRFVKLVRDFRRQGVARPDERILVVTFTNDAARSMRERIQQRLTAAGEPMLGPDAWIGTFHQLCMRILRTHPLDLGLPPDFAILNPLEQQVLFNRTLQGVLAGEVADLSAVLAGQNLADCLPADILSLESLQVVGLEDIESLLEPGRLFRLISRIKTAGLSPLEFLEAARAQTVRFTERLKTLPTPHDKALGKPENMAEKLSAWQDSLQAWAHADWRPVDMAEAKAEVRDKKATASDYKAELKGLCDLYLLPKTFEPMTPDFSLLDKAMAQELQLIDRIAALYALYQQALLREGACDFDDLINHAIALLSSRPALRTHYREQFSAVIVDEFQDSNGSQLRLLSLLMREGAKNLTVVGDAKQSIYAFRFAQPENLDLIFQKTDCLSINLQTNYRSRPPVLMVANQLTDWMTADEKQRLIPCERYQAQHLPLVTWLNFDAVDETCDKPRPRSLESQKALEADFIALEIARLVQQGDAQFSDIAVLVKSHAKAEVIQASLAALSIPSVRQKNLGFFQEGVIRDAMALLRLMRSLSDDASLVRILQGKLNQKQILELMRLRGLLKDNGQPSSLFDACLYLKEHPEALPALPQPVAHAVSDLATQLLTIWKRKSRLSAAHLFLELAGHIGLIDPSLPEWRQKQQRISLRTFERLLVLFGCRKSGRNRSLQPTLDEVIEILEQYAADPSQELPVSEELSGEDAVRIMTVFAAKGLEFPVVFTCYTEKARAGNAAGDNALLFDPQYAGKAGFGLMLGKVNGRSNLKTEVYQRCWQAPRAATEAQRVFYVALTRARERLYVLRGDQSFDWTAPGDYPRDAIRVLSEARDAETLAADYWNADRAALRQAMAALQEAKRAKASA